MKDKDKVLSLKSAEKQLQRLVTNHKKLEDEIHVLEKVRYLNPSDEQKIKKLKSQKLHEKDKIVSIKKKLEAA